ncbi:MAG: sensor histidine kinase [Trebonia sp.]
MIRCAGFVYIVVQTVIWHSFYAAAPWRLTAPVAAAVWAVAAAAFLRRRWPSPFLACVDAAVYIALAFTAQNCVPPAVRDDPFSWMVISISGQLMVPAWYAPGVLSVLLALASPVAFGAGAALRPVTDARTLAGAAVLLFIVALVHLYGRRVLRDGAAEADAGVARADQAAREQYAILRANIERREHERLLHDTVLNTLTALGRADRVDTGEAVTACRRDMALLESALSDRDDAQAGRPSGDLLRELRAVVADMRVRGLNVHAEFDEGAGLTVPARVITAITNAAREALSNAAAHAGTGEAWVTARRTGPDLIGPGPTGPGLTAPEEPDGSPSRLEVTVRDEGTGFDPALVDSARLGLRRSIAERVADCGGEASIRSAPGRGTTVTLRWPASPRPAPAAPTSTNAPAEPTSAPTEPATGSRSW